MTPVAYAFYSIAADTATYAKSVAWQNITGKPDLGKGIGAKSIGGFQIANSTISLSNLAPNINASSINFTATSSQFCVISGTSTYSVKTGTSTFSNNLTGGTAGAIPYQSGLNATGFIAPGTPGSLLYSNGV